MKATNLQTLLFSLLFLAAFAVQATQITVSSDPNRVAQYTNVQSAIDDATDGDTLLIYGSPSSYGDIVINQKSLVLIGEGYNSNLSLITSFGTVGIGRFDSNNSANGTTLLGLRISNLSINANWSGSDNSTRTLQNIDVLRCEITDINIAPGSFIVHTISDLNFINCLINDDIELGRAFGVSGSTTYVDFLDDITFSNCVFSSVDINSRLRRDAGVLSAFIDLSGVRIFNSVFVDGVNNGFLDQTVNLVLEDNIFFGHELYGGDYAQITWNNNLFYLTDQTPLGSNDNVGSGNILNTDPQFTDYPATPTGFSYDHDYTLQAGSPALTASVNGEEIGIYGGAYPFEVGAQPPVPQIIEVTIQDGTSSVPQGGTINFNFKAKSGN